MGTVCKTLHNVWCLMHRELIVFSNPDFLRLATAITKRPGLAELQLYGTTLRDLVSALKHLQEDGRPCNLSNVKALFFADDVSKTFSGLSVQLPHVLPGLESITLRSVELPPPQTPFWTELSRLSSLGLEQCDVSVDTIMTLASITTLQSLSLELPSDPPPEAEHGHSVLLALGTLTSLNSLRILLLPGDSYTGISHLSRLTALTKLHCDVNLQVQPNSFECNQSVARLSTLTRLQQLHLECQVLNDEGLCELAALQQLTQLWVLDLDISAQCPHLGAMSGLRSLKFQGPAKPAMLRRLLGDAPQLQSPDWGTLLPWQVSCTGNRYAASAEGVRQLADDMHVVLSWPACNRQFLMMMNCLGPTGESDYQFHMGPVLGALSVAAAWMRRLTLSGMLLSSACLRQLLAASPQLNSLSLFVCRLEPRALLGLLPLANKRRSKDLFLSSCTSLGAQHGTSWVEEVVHFCRQVQKRGRLQLFFTPDLEEEKEQLKALLRQHPTRVQVKW